MFKNLIFTTRQNFETEISKRAMEANEQISNEMGAEVHDDLIQKLTIFSLYLDRLERAANHPEEVESLILKMRGDFNEMATSVRSISRKLMPVNFAEETFNHNVEMLCQNSERPGQGMVHFEISGNESEISKEAKKYLHRIVQELVHNAFKHSSAWHVWVRLIWSGEKLVIEVEDDGTAFSTIHEQIVRLESKYNTLKMRSMAIGARLSYHQGQKGLLARTRYQLKN
jgi:signal transduction histidine kinase